MCVDCGCPTRMICICCTEQLYSSLYSQLYSSRTAVLSTPFTTRFTAWFTVCRRQACCQPAIDGTVTRTVHCALEALLFFSWYSLRWTESKSAKGCV